MVQRITLLDPLKSSEGNAGDFTDLPSPQAATPQAANASNTIEQVRELLYGDAMRLHGRRLDNVEEDVQSLDQRVLRRFDEMQASIDTLARALRAEQSDAMRAIGITIMEMGRQIATMGESGDRGADRKPR